MEIKQRKLEELKGKNAFKIPEGYMEGLTERIMTLIPENSYREAKVVSLFGNIRPWLYLAAVFAGIIITFRVFISPGLIEKEPTVEASSNLQAFISSELLSNISDDDLEYLEYIENQFLDHEFAEELDYLDY